MWSWNGHSYGGIPACIATHGNSVKERALRELPGGLPTCGL